MARTSKLSRAQRECMRDIHDHERGHQWHRWPTLDSLVKKGLIESTPGGNFTLTEAGRREYDLIMESGDGPEALKEMFRF